MINIFFPKYIKGLIVNEALLIEKSDFFDKIIENNQYEEFLNICLNLKTNIEKDHDFISKHEEFQEVIKLGGANNPSKLISLFKIKAEESLDSVILKIINHTINTELKSEYKIPEIREYYLRKETLVFYPESWFHHWNLVFSQDEFFEMINFKSNQIDILDDFENDNIAEKLTVDFEEYTHKSGKLFLDSFSLKIDSQNKYPQLLFILLKRLKNYDKEVKILLKIG